MDREFDEESVLTACALRFDGYAYHDLRNRGDGRWVVSIRGAQLSADRRSALAHCGGGIVAESDPGDELDETTTKFRTILSGLGVDT